MKIIVLIAAAILIGGCASTGSDSGDSRLFSSVQGEAQLKARDPYLLTCPANAAPICDQWGGRTNKRLVNCRCDRF